MIVSPPIKPLTTAFTEVFWVPLNPGLPLNVTMVHLTNNSNSPVNIRMCYVATGDSPTMANAVLWDFSLPAHDFLEFGAGDIVQAGTSIQAMASANSAVNVKLAGTQN